MTIAVKVDEQGNILTYPYTKEMFRADYPDTIMRPNWRECDLTDFGVHWVLEVDPPAPGATNKLVEQPPLWDGAQWVQQWTLVPMTAAEIDAIRVFNVPQAVQRWQFKLALLDLALLDSVMASLNALPAAARHRVMVEWEGRSIIERDGAFLAQLQTRMGWTNRQVEDIMTKAGTYQ